MDNEGIHDVIMFSVDSLIKHKYSIIILGILVLALRQWKRITMSRGTSASKDGATSESNAVYLTRFKYDSYVLYLVHTAYGIVDYFSNLNNFFCLMVAIGQILMYGEYRTLIPLGLFMMMSVAFHLYQTSSRIREQIMINRTPIRLDRGTVALRDLRHGDKVTVDPDRIIPADIELLEGKCVVSELNLTGEAVNLTKEPSDHPVGSSNMVFRGTTVVRGTATGVVRAIGNDCRMYRINMSSKQAATPMQQTINEIFKVNALVLFSLSVIIGFILYEKNQTKGTKGLVASIVSVGLLINTVIPLSLQFFYNAACMQISKQIEQLDIKINAKGIQSFQHNPVHIVSDKTGTLTTGEMKLAAVLELQQQRIIETPTPEECYDIRACCADTDGLSGGDPCENALLAFTASGGCNCRYLMIYSRPFNRDIGGKMAIYQWDKERYTLHIQGIPERLLPDLDPYYIVSSRVQAPPKDTYQRLIASVTTEITHDEYLAIRKDPTVFKVNVAWNGRAVRRYLYVFLDGLVPGLSEAIRRSVGSGTFTMLTGDSIVSARSVMQSLGIGQGIYISGDEFEAEADTEAFKAKYPYPVTVIYRASPHIKQKYVEYLQNRGQTVMMVGDGPNDAAALAEAAIGVAIRSNESQMAQNIADIVVNNWTQIPDILEKSKDKQVIMGHVVDLVLLKHMLTGCTLLGIMLASYYNSVKDPADPFLMAAFNAVVFLMMTIYIATASPSPSDRTGANYIRGGQSGIVTGLALGAWIHVLPDDHSKIHIAICVQLAILLLYIASRTQGIQRYLWITASLLAVYIGAQVQGDKYGYYTSLALSLVF